MRASPMHMPPRKNQIAGGYHPAPKLSERHNDQPNTGHATSRLTDFPEEVLRDYDFGCWFLGHYHDHRIIDKRFILQRGLMPELSHWLESFLK